jgi:hypothetical protein
MSQFGKWYQNQQDFAEYNMQYQHSVIGPQLMVRQKSGQKRQSGESQQHIVPYPRKDTHFAAHDPSDDKKKG